MRRTGITRRSPLRAVSAKRRSQAAELSQWRDLVVRRAGWRCQRCKRLDDTVEAHHIGQRSTHPHLLTDPANGAALCAECHRHVHTHVAESLADGWLIASWERPS